MIDFQSTVPAWAATTTYLPGARVTPVVPDTTNWVTYAGGVSGNAQPTWPTVDPWSVVDGSVTWTIGSSFRQLVSAGLLSVLTAFRDANPTLLKGVRTARPNSYDNVDKPGAFIDGGDEVLTWPQSQRQRDLSTTVTVFTAVPDIAEGQNGMDVLIDGLLDAFTHAYHAASGRSIVLPTGIRQIELTDRGSSYLGYTFTFSNTVQEGRN